MNDRLAVTDALSELLSSLGFIQMAQDVRSETDPRRLSRYARVVMRATHDVAMRRELAIRFRALGLV